MKIIKDSDLEYIPFLGDKTLTLQATTHSSSIQKISDCFSPCIQSMKYNLISPSDRQWEFRNSPKDLKAVSISFLKIYAIDLYYQEL